MLRTHRHAPPLGVPPRHRKGRPPPRRDSRRRHPHDQRDTLHARRQLVIDQHEDGTFTIGMLQREGLHDQRPGEFCLDVGERRVYVSEENARIPTGQTLGSSNTMNEQWRERQPHTAMTLAGRTGSGSDVVTTSRITATWCKGRLDGAGVGQVALLPLVGVPVRVAEAREYFHAIGDGCWNLRSIKRWEACPARS